jgi:hypothetical protein
MLCKHFINGNCRNGNNCKFEHKEKVCKNFFFGECEKEECKFSHSDKLVKPREDGDGNDRPRRFNNFNDKSREDGDGDGNGNDRPRRFNNFNDRSREDGDGNDRPRRFNNFNDRSGDGNDRPRRFNNFNDRSREDGEYNDRFRNNNQRRMKKKNTEPFEKGTKQNNIRIRISTDPKLVETVGDNDVIIVPNLFNDPTIHKGLLAEVKGKELFKLCHGDNHFIADDDLEWKDDSPIFLSVVDKIKNYFTMDVKLTRLNLYANSQQWKPYHFDAVELDETDTPNCTVGASFGETRTISFEHDRTRMIIDFPLPDGSIYAFGKNINTEWRHGVPEPVEKSDAGRTSIIAWGKV